MTSIRPSDMSSGAQPFNNTNKNVRIVANMSLDDVIAEYIYPPADPNGYLDIRDIPSIWNRCSGMFSAPHIFLHAFCLASADKQLALLAERREQAYQTCDLVGDEGGLLWLEMRPAYSFSMASGRGRRQFNTWNWDMKMALGKLAGDRGQSMKALLIIYGSLSMLSSGEDLSSWRAVLAAEVENWNIWLGEEIGNISRKFSLNQS